MGRRRFYAAPFGPGWFSTWYRDVRVNTNPFGSKVANLARLVHAAGTAMTNRVEPWIG
ncbi:MAG TPA: hypothetical protein VFZ65_16025 [Planctomycetota bacterium]|nr:hypothetical protein [Planctomycetota bacterium]